MTRRIDADFLPTTSARAADTTALAIFRIDLNVVPDRNPKIKFSSPFNRTSRSFAVPDGCDFSESAKRSKSCKALQGSHDPVSYQGQHSPFGRRASHPKFSPSSASSPSSSTSIRKNPNPHNRANMTKCPSQSLYTFPMTSIGARRSLTLKQSWLLT